jgi:hypothetical protein
MKKTLIASLGAFGIALLSAAIALSTVPNGAIAAAHAAGSYSQAHVLQPGSRGSVVEI